MEVNVAGDPILWCQSVKVGDLTQISVLYFLRIGRPFSGIAVSMLTRRGLETPHAMTGFTEEDISRASKTSDDAQYWCVSVHLFSLIGRVFNPYIAAASSFSL